MSTKHRTIHLHIYRGIQGVSGVVKGENGKVANENHLVKLIHNTIEWDNYLKMLVTNGFVKVDVVGYCDGVNKDGSFQYSEVEDSVNKDVYNAMYGDKEVKLTPEQKEIAELKAQMKELIAGKKAPKKEKEVKANKEQKENASDEDLAKARQDYMDAFGKKGHHSWSVDHINELIKNK